jgi:hypothetical protein
LHFESWIEAQLSDISCHLVFPQTAKSLGLLEPNGLLWQPQKTESALGLGRGLFEAAIENENMFSKTDNVRAGSLQIFKVTIVRIQSCGFDTVHTCSTTRSILSVAITLPVTRLRNWYRQPEP